MDPALNDTPFSTNDTSTHLRAEIGATKDNCFVGEARDQIGEKPSVEGASVLTSIRRAEARRDFEAPNVLG